jgi:Flp pilus assembly pilin Flp
LLGWKRRSDWYAHPSRRVTAADLAVSDGRASNRRETPVITTLQVKAFSAFSAASSLLAAEEGQALVEYALILAAVSIAAIAGLTTLGTGVSGIFSKLNTDFQL